MKKLLLSVILFVALLAVPANAQLTNQRVEAKANGITWYMTGVADSMASLTSTAQSFIDYDNVDYYTIYYKFTAAVVSLARITFSILICHNGALCFHDRTARIVL